VTKADARKLHAHELDAAHPLETDAHDILNDWRQQAG